GTTSFFVRLGAALVKDSLLSRDTRLRVVAFGGEDCPSVAMLKRWSGIGNTTEFYNLYGTTEVSCWSTCHRIDLVTTRDAKYVPLGDPLDATVLEVRNELGEVISEGDGLLFIGGLNKQCLVGNETWDQIGPSYLRNSGDLVHASGGVLTFLGRRDSNFKYNNRLVHCALLTKTLLSSGPVETCHGHYSKPEKMLFLFVTLAQDCAPEEAMPPLRSSIEQHCECPFQIVPVRTLPLNCHGKVDVQTLLYQSKKEGLLDYGFAYRQHLSKLWKDMEFATNCSLPLLAHKVLGGTFEDVAAYVDKAIRRAPECREHFKPGLKICVDESTVGFKGHFKGRVSFNYYNPQKTTKWGLWVYVLVDSATRYVSAFEPYCDSTTTESLAPARPFFHLPKRPSPPRQSAVRFAGKGVPPYTDAYYTSPTLAEVLLLQGVKLNGT
ncbi:AMP dependent ligase, putative, partial [Ixodes scapularis]